MFGRTLYFFFVSLFWLILFVVLLELFEASRAYFAEHAYEDYFDAQNRKVYRMVPADELAATVKQFSLPENENTIPNTEYGYDVFQEKRNTCYFSSEETDVEPAVRAALHGELFLTFDRTGTLLSSYGEPFLEQYLVPYLSGQKKAPLGMEPVFRDLPEKVQKLKRPSFEHAFYPAYGFPHYYTVFFIPQHDSQDRITSVDVRIHEITDSKPLSERMTPPFPDKESSWEIPFFYYKKNWSKPDSILSTNNFGFRDDDVILPKPQESFRIVCIGGSTTEEGSSNENTYPNIVERKLCSYFGADTVDVVNCGICGITTCRQRRRIADYLALEPDLLLFYVGVNDICHNYFSKWLEAPKKEKPLWCRSRFLLRHFNRYVLPSDAELAEFLRATTLRNIQAMHYAASQKNIKVAICSFAYPRPPFFDFKARNYYDVNMREVWEGGGLVNFKTYTKVIDLYNRLLKEMCAELGIFYVPLAENFHASSEHFFDICHMTPLGLEMKSNIIDAYMREYITDFGCPFKKNSTMKVRK